MLGFISSWLEEYHERRRQERLRLREKLSSEAGSRKSLESDGPGFIWPGNYGDAPSCHTSHHNDLGCSFSDGGSSGSDGESCGGGD